MPEETLLTIQIALENLDSLKYLEETPPAGFHCSKFSHSGIIIVTNLRLSFFYITDENEFKYEHFVYQLLTKACFNIINNNYNLEISYAYNKIKFSFNHRADILKVKDLLETYIPEKTSVLAFEEESKETLPVIKAPPDKKGNGTSIISYKGTDLLISNQTKPLVLAENLTRKFNLKYKLKKILLNSFSYSIIFGIVVIILPFMNKIKDKTYKISSYAFNFIQIQQCETQIIEIAKGLNEYAKTYKTYPDNFSAFLRGHFKNAMKQDTAKDPWGSLYLLKEEGENLTIISFGPDKTNSTFDDIIRNFRKIKITSEDSPFSAP